MTKPTLCLDFDGVLHRYDSGWQGAAVIPDPPVDGAMEFLRDAIDHFKVEIFSSRSHQPGGVNAMSTWIYAHLARKFGHSMAGTVSALLSFPTTKPAAFLSIDDRALTFDGTWPSIETLLAFKPWNKKEPAPAQVA